MKGKIDIKNMVKLGFVLAVFAAAACVMLAFVYTGTSKQIARRQQADLDAALKDIFPDADGFEPVEDIKSPDTAVAIESAYRADRNGKTAGAALEVSRAGYSGPIKMMVGISVDGIITGVKILEHSETPGLGANASSPSYFVDRTRGITFYGQFAGKNTGDAFEAKGDVVAITASTVTSAAVASAVRAAGIAAMTWFAGVELDSVSGIGVIGGTSIGGDE